MTDPQMFDADEKLVPGPALRPKDAATLIIVRRDKDAIRVLMGQRHAKMAFQPNKFVFPGGRIDPCDMRIAAGGELRPDVARKVENGISPARARGLALAAVRETFEETGVLIGEKSTEKPRTLPRGNTISRTASCRGWTNSISSPALSPRPAARAASMRGSSWWMQAPSPTKSTPRTRKNC